MFFKIIKFIILIHIFGIKGQSTKTIIVVDGPSSVSMSKKISLESDELNYLVPFHYMPSVLKSGIKLELIIAPAFSDYFFALFSVLGKLAPLNGSLLFIDFASILINCYIKKNKNSLANVVVFNERGPFASSAISVAKKYKIRTCCIQHGAIVDNYFPIGVDLYFTWSEFFSEIIKSNCANVLPINVGRLDYSGVENKVQNRLDEPLIALQPGNVSIPFEILLNEFVDVVEVCLNTFGGVVLRRHPNDNISNDIISIFNGDDRISFDNDLLIESLMKRKIVVSLYSTVLLEAALAGCLPVQYVSDKWYKPIYQRSCNVLNGKENLKYFLENVKKNSSYAEPWGGADIIGRSNFKLFFEKLKLS